MNEAFLVENLLLVIAAAVVSVWVLSLVLRRAIDHAVYRLVPLPGIFFFSIDAMR